MVLNDYLAGRVHEGRDQTSVLLSVAIVHHEIKKMTKEKKYLSHLEIQKEEGSEN